MKERNNFRLAVQLNGEWTISHFNLKEFENSKGWAMVHSSVIASLEMLRTELTKLIGEEVEIVITDSTRTEAENENLGKLYGWIDNGGKVAKDSKHLEKYGGIAVDFFARTKPNKRYIPTKLVGEIAKRYFDFVKSDYADGHIHADNRHQLGCENMM